MAPARPGLGLAPGVPDDYYARIAAVEADHWWHVAMREATSTLLRPQLGPAPRALLDVGCGTGGFLRWAAASGEFARLAGCDVSSEAIERAGRSGSAPDLRVSPIHALPFADRAFDVVTVNDVLQHVPETHVDAGLRECRRVLRPGGALLVRTGGARRARRDRSDWAVYDRPTLRAQLERAGLRPQRVTFVSFAPSVWAAARGAAPRAPEAGEGARDGVPEPTSGPRDRLAGAALRLERRWLAAGRDVRFGHTLIAVARA